MRYRTEKTIVDEKGHKFKIGDTVTVKYNKESGSYGGGFGGVGSRITEYQEHDI